MREHDGRGADPRDATAGSRSRYALVERVAALAPADCSVLRDRYAVVVGCGALGSAVAEHLVRGGVGRVGVVDRDVVEPRNLAHQVLYTERDAAAGRLKAEAAARRLRTLNAGCAVEGVVADCAPDNVLRLTAGADVVVDGVDNVESKLLLNDAAVANGTPLVHGGCAGTEGAVLAVLPGVTHCLRCLWPEPGGAAARRTCETRGLLPGTAAVVAALQATEALKLLLGLGADALSGLVRIDTWDAALRRVPLPPFAAVSGSCPACGKRDFGYLRGRHTTAARELCGEDTVLLSAPAGGLDLECLRERHRGNATLRARPGCVQLDVDGCRIVAFSSGRTLIHGAGGMNRARALYARHVSG
ncbi:ThiF family adenylyltransferase [Streptomyces sp. F63]|uniref:ThiF family adenylyltransferase n=1 Tax=Streptomyces sp. F63 TaxID=2824887 RepID=UPI001B36E5C2|nr:ThiF family adenylyltransferase [Streptomyces sp. F63]MBQ0984726.1 ThiF family adenylyltransferase [Streptomyces sp. F63]